MENEEQRQEINEENRENGEGFANDTAGTGKEDEGKEEVGKEDAGKDVGKEDVGKEEAGKEEMGKEDEGKEEMGKEDEGKEEMGKEEVGKEEVGKEEVGKEEMGKEEAGKEEEGKVDEGKEEVGKEEVGKEDEGKEDGNVNGNEEPVPISGSMMPEDMEAIITETSPSEEQMLLTKTESVKDEMPMVTLKVPGAVNILTEEMIREGISLVDKTADDIHYCFVKLQLDGRNLTNIDLLSTYIHLRIIDLNGNHIPSLSTFEKMENLIYLSLENNNIVDLEISSNPYLQYLSLKKNSIDTIAEGLEHRNIRYLDLSYNQLTQLTMFKEVTLPELTTLKLEGNKISLIGTLNIPSLKYLRLNSNEISSLTWVSTLVNLEELYLGGNRIANLDGFNENLVNLSKLDLSNNALQEFAEFEKLGGLPVLKEMFLVENPMSQDNDHRVEILIVVRTLISLDDDEYSEEEMIAARGIAKQRLEDQRAREMAKREQEERERLEREEEERERLETEQQEREQLEMERMEREQARIET